MYFSDLVFVALNVLEHLPCDFGKRVVLHLWKLEMEHLPSLDPLPGLAIRRLHEGSKVLRAVLRVPMCQCAGFLHLYKFWGHERKIKAHFSLIFY
jgi:hypothetical protein